jgi:hypothetical protein
LLRQVLFLLPLIVAHCARTLVAEVCEVVMAGVAVGPCDIHAGARGHMDFHAGRFSSNVKRYRHRLTILAEVFSVPHRTI